MTSIHDDDRGSRSARTPVPPQVSGRMPAEWERLARRKDELETVLAAGRIGYCRVRAADGAIEANSQFKAEWGWPPDETLSWEAVESRVSADDRPRFSEAVRQALATATPLDLIVRVQPPQSGTRWLALRGCVARGPDEDASAELIVTSRNVTIEREA